MTTMRRSAFTLVIAMTLAAAAAGCSGESGPRPALDAFIKLWTQDKQDGVVLVDSSGASVTAATAGTELKHLAGDLVPGQAKLTPNGDPKADGDQATAPVTVEWTVAKGVVWKYETTIKLNRKDKTWRVIWTPADVHPQLQPGDTLSAHAVAAERGQILDNAGGGIVKPRPVVVVGIQPRLVTNLAALVAALDAAFKSVGVSVSLSDLPAQIAAAKPDAFVTVVTLRREAYDSIRSKIRDLPGTVFQEATLPLAPSRPFARALLGTVGEVTKEQMDKHPGTYVVGDQVGQSGLQGQFDATLRGTSGVKVLISGRKDGDVELFSTQPVAGQSLKTTLDQRIQNAADAALAGQPNRSALVAVRVSDGAILAAANGPDGGEVNLAFTASVPPGSTFKMVTALGLLDKGAVGLDTVVNCPKTFSVDGRSFANASNFELGAVAFRVDFAKSCNTAFASLADKLDPDGLRKAGAAVGIGTAWNPGADAFTGSVPANASRVEAAAAAFGQGQTVVSPLAMAAATAAVARGSWQPAKLFTELPPGAPAPSAGSTTAAGAALNPASVTALRTLMREVVTAGTATSIADVPGQPVYAKTGTAEFDNNPADTHAWTIGWRGDVAFAVFVEKGGSSSATALPIVERFLRAV
jgi:cell division protein FtsI/penicillin-binding protein 2